MSEEIENQNSEPGKNTLKILEASAEMLNVSEYVETMLIRIRTMLADTRMSKISDEKDIALDQWLTDYIDGNKAKNGCLTIIDLSLVPSEIIHINYCSFSVQYFSHLLDQ